jgi:hypothetical protein
MNALGWTIMLVSWCSIFALCGFCFAKILGTAEENIHAPLDIDTGDADTGDTPAS